MFYFSSVTKKGLILSFLLCAVLTGLFAQEKRDSVKVHQLQEVGIYGEAKPSSVRSAAPLQAMDKKEMERIGLQEVSEAVKRFSGVSVKDYGGIGGLKTVSIRSMGAQHTAVSYDGVVLSDCQSGQVDIGRFSLDNVSMLTLSIGQADDIFQTARMAASAGALSIKTSAPRFFDKNYQAQVQLKGGSFGLINPSLMYAHKLSNRFSASVTADWMRADGNYPFRLINGDQEYKGKRTNTDIQSLRTELNLHSDLRRYGTLNFKAYYFDSERGLPGSVILYNDYSKERLFDKTFFTQAFYENRFSDRWSLRANLKYNRAYNRYIDINNKYESGRQVDRYTQQEYYGSATVLYQPLQGLSFSLAEDLSFNKLDNNFADCPYPERITSLTALSGQYRYKHFSVTASALGTYISEEVKSGDRPADRKRLSPAVSLSYQPWMSQNFRIRASYKDIFRIPTFNDLYYPRMGNTNLRPENAKQYNAGLTWMGSPFSSSFVRTTVDAYYNKIDDKIVALPTLFLWHMMNMGEVEIAGVDATLSAEFPLTDDIKMTFAGSYTYQDAIDVTDETAKNYKHQIPYTPKHSGSASVSTENTWVNVTYSLMASSERYMLPQNIGDNRIKGYVEHTLSANRTFPIGRCKLRLQAELINLTDKTYEVIKWYPMPGRSYRLLARINF
ncbi:MAG: TonB-dependent receptor [Bacteroidaceae bacterium]|nr:TonB-dependent receptor [Bacteroidaceae bacterium]